MNSEATDAEVEPIDAAATRRRKRRRRRLLDKVTNPCTCSGYAATGRAPIRQQRPATAFDLCECQIRRAWQLTFPSGHPARMAKVLWSLDPTPEDVEQIEWVCLLNLGDWVEPDDRPGLAGLDLGTRTYAAAMDAVRAHRGGRLAEEARDCPPLADLLQAEARGDRNAMHLAGERLAEWRRMIQLRRLGVPERQIEQWINESRTHQDRKEGYV